MNDTIYILEFKVDGSGNALEQIKEKNYQQDYLNTGEIIYLIGIDFSSEEKNISKCE